MATFVNLTPHAVTIGDHTFPPSGQIARVEEETTLVRVVDGIPIVRVTPGQVVGLPGPEEGTWYIVSRVVPPAAPERKDLLFPGALIRDESGRVIGAASLAQM